MVNVPLPESVADLLSQRAKAGGLSLPEFVIWLLEQTSQNGANGHSRSADQKLAFDQFMKSMREWGEQHIPPGHFVDDSRESIYEGRGE